MPRWLLFNKYIVAFEFHNIHRIISVVVRVNETLFKIVDQSGIIAVKLVINFNYIEKNQQRVCDILIILDDLSFVIANYHILIRSNSIDRVGIRCEMPALTIFICCRCRLLRFVCVYVCALQVALSSCCFHPLNCYVDHGSEVELICVHKLPFDYAAYYSTGC